MFEKYMMYSLKIVINIVGVEKYYLYFYPSSYVNIPTVRKNPIKMETLEKK